PVHDRWLFLAGAPLLVGAWAAANLLMGAAYALHRHASISRSYLLSAVVLPLTTYALRRHGPASFLAAVMADKLVSICSLWLDAPVRALCSRVLRAPAPAGKLGRVLREYLPVVTPRLTLLLLSSALVAVAAALLAPAHLAGFKVSLSFVSASASLVPVSQYALQAHWRDDVPHREARVVFAGVF